MHYLSDTEGYLQAELFTDLPQTFDEEVGHTPPSEHSLEFNRTNAYGDLYGQSQNPGMWMLCI